LEILSFATAFATGKNRTVNQVLYLLPTYYSEIVMEIMHHIL